MIINNRNQSRQIFYESWKKFRQSIPLEPMEALISTVIQGHPEYHSLFESPDADLVADAEFDGKPNPFLHMGLHIAVLEQVSTDRPNGMTSLYKALLTKYTDEHQLQHQIMQFLEESLWKAQQHGTMPDEKEYMENLRKM